MKDLQLVTLYKSVAFDELDDVKRALVEQARQATFRSYAPYSNFKVGAAILLSNGETVTGSNQENAAFPSGTCAERTAAYYANSRYPDARFEMIAVAARGTDDEWVPAPISPCGACRQALLEYETLAGHPVTVLLAGRNEVYILPSVRALLPFGFSEF